MVKVLFLLTQWSSASPPLASCALREVKGERPLSETVLSNSVADTPGCVLGTWWKDVLPRGFKSVFQMRKLNSSDQRTTGLSEEGVRKEGQFRLNCAAVLLEVLTCAALAV